MKDSLKKLISIEYVFLLLIILFLLVINYLLLEPLVSLPGPIYGGDLYFQLSQTNHFKYGGNLLQASNVKGALPFYMVAYTAVAGPIARFFDVSGITAQFIASYLIILASCISVFFLSKKLLGSYNYSFIGVFAVIIFVRAIEFPVLKYTVFVHLVFMPLLLLLLYNYLKNRTYVNAVLLGLIYGLTGLGHAIAFISVTFLLAFVFFFYELKPLLKEKKKVLPWIFSLRFYALVVLIGVCIAMLWWFRPVFVHHGQIPTEQRESGTVSFEPFSTQLTFAYDTIKSYVFNFRNAFEIILSLLTLLGLFGLFFIKNKTFENNYIKFILISSIIILFHYFITQNLLGTYFVPEYISYFLVLTVRTIIAVFGLVTLYALIGKIPKFPKTKLAKDIFIGVFIIVFVILQVNAYQGREASDRWYSAGKNELPPYLVSVQDYLVKNTDVYDTILTTKEVGFAVNALSGRKLVLTRRAHNDPFFDMEPRDLDAAIMLYGNDSQKTRELLQKYEVKYVYWDSYWIQSEYIFDNEGKLTSWYDPIMLFRTDEKEEVLKQYNVSYFVQNTWIDPSVRGDDVKKYDLIFVSPQNYRSYDKPWSEVLDQFLTEIWSYPQGETTLARLYRVNI